MSDKAKPQKGSIDDFAERFEALASEASGYGMSCVWGVLDEDPIAKTVRPEWGWEGNPFTCEAFCSALGAYIAIHTDLMSFEDDEGVNGDSEG